ncbi:Ger(x)C family spore germination protein [Paenibacillus solisilvae]|uniref:Ger(X)C family spore germination protein n=1 Tax=Paenibacillus solisilvae TaxID=2486751 RepID=A0ABW0W199_9BACL
MTRKAGILCILILLSLFFSGCWNRRELNEIAIAVAIGIDKAGDDQYRLSVQVVDPGQVAHSVGGVGDQAVVTLYTISGKTIFEALRKMTTISPRRIFLSHLHVLVIGEEMAREGIAKPLDFISRNNEVRTDFFIIAAKGTTAENVLNVLTPIEKIPSNYMFSSLERSEKEWAPTATITLDELLANLMTKGRHPVLTAVEVIGNPESGTDNSNVEKIKPPTMLKYSELGVFKKDRLIGWLSEEKSKGYSYIRDRVVSTIGIVRCPGGGSASMEVVDVDTKVKGRVENGKPAIDVNIRIEQRVGEFTCTMDLTKPETIQKLNKLSNKRVEEVVRSSVNTVQRTFKVDIFGFGDAVHRADPKAWKKLEPQWDKLFPKLTVRIKSNVQTRETGTVKNYFMKQREE